MKEAAINAEKVAAKHLVLYHTVDTTLESRRKLYTAEASGHFHGEVYVPDDLDVIDMD